MIQRRPLLRGLATFLIVILPCIWSPTPAAIEGSTLHGSILSAADQGPLTGARLHVGDPRTGKIYSSEIVADDGAFVVADLPSATYELAVESEGHLYVVGTPLQLEPGQSRTVNVEVDTDAAPNPVDAEKKKKKGATTIWDNPLTAALIVVASAIVVGLILNGNDNEPRPSGSMN